MKRILNKCDDEYLALLTYRNTPPHNGYSSAQLSMGRRLKTRVPIHPEELMPQLPDLDLVRKREKQYRATMAANYDHRHAVVEGTPLSAGDRVLIPDLQTEGNVIRNLQVPRSVLIETSRSIVRSNRRMTRRLSASHTGTTHGRRAEKVAILASASSFAGCASPCATRASSALDQR